ncbi:hypothetical protein F5B21DRAFT_516479 [Xylaria acuta]|nr:hypothetical protein F5B21DRAFT_516479 [Xylaria acuta]
MDPVTALGAAGSVVGIAGFGIQLYQILSKFVSQVRSAQEQFEEVIAEIDSTTSALEEIYFYLEQEVRNVEAGKALELFSESSLVKVKVTADKCLVVFWRIETAIAGSEPERFDDELANRLTSFNQKLASYCTGHTINIEPQLTSDPLRFRDKLRWAFQSSKLEKFCKELQRYQSHLGLLLQIVLLGQQQTKQHPTNRDNIEIRQIYAFMKIATPEELRLMASEAQEDGERRRGRSRRPASSRIRLLSEYSQIQSPTGRNSSNIIRLPEHRIQWNNIDPQAKKNFASSDTDTGHMRITSPQDRLPTITYETTNGPLDSRKMANNDSGKYTLDRSVQGKIAAYNHASDASVPSARAHSPVVTGKENTSGLGVKGSPSATTPSEHGIDEKTALDAPKRGSVSVTGASGTEILPYVIQEEGAYRLPITFISEHDMAMELAFLSPGQIQTLQQLLQYRNETEPRKLVGLEQRQATVAFIEGAASDTPGLLLPQADASRSQMDGMAYLQSTRQVNHGRAPSAIGLPEFQDVTNDLSNKMHIPWGQASIGDRFTEYRSAKDWARSLLKEETLPRVEIKRRLKILDKDQATFQIWHVQWSLRQLEIIRARRFFIVKQVKAIIVYVSKVPRPLHHDAPDGASEIALPYVPHKFYNAPHGKSIDAKHNAAARTPTSSADSIGTQSVKSGPLSAERPNNRKSAGQNDAKVDEAIARANSRIASRPPIPSLTRRQTLTTPDEYSEPDYESAGIYDRKREEELERKIRHLRLEIKLRRELEEESERRGRTMREMQREIRSERRNEADRAEREPLSPQNIQYLIDEGHERKVADPEDKTRSFESRSRDRYAIGEGSPQNRANLTYYNNPETENSRVPYPSQFDRRRFDPRLVAESQNAVKQLLLEWTPAHMRAGDNEDNIVSAAYDEGNSMSDTGSEEYVMAEEFPTSGPSLTLQREQARDRHSESATKVDDDSWSWKVRRRRADGILPPMADDAGGHQDSFIQDTEKATQDDVVLRGWGTWRGRTGLVSSSPQQLSRPWSKKANDANRVDENSQRDVRQADTWREPTTQQTNDGIRPSQKGKNIARASTLPQTSRQPWSDVEWARQVVEETARTEEDSAGLDRLRGRRASFHFPKSRSLEPELRTNRRQPSPTHICTVSDGWVPM